MPLLTEQRFIELCRLWVFLVLMCDVFTYQQVFKRQEACTIQIEIAVILTSSLCAVLCTPSANLKPGVSCSHLPLPSCCDTCFLQTPFAFKTSNNCTFDAKMYLPWGQCHGCLSTLSEILNSLPIWTWGNDGALSFAANNFKPDPTASHFGIPSFIICILHLLPRTDLSIWFYSQATYLQ